ncbi:hypothetical protein FQA47_000944 [Oryzias melastigma]|uniref:Uncharacterized protein n=1 Tax=Oryzias melastigma TaxID=30732 RepID=A0A834F323_ORYME|nr:hypothetical protein FQA47_000944 [Oryzias melastigma]
MSRSVCLYARSCGRVIIMCELLRKRPTSAGVSGSRPLQLDELLPLFALLILLSTLAIQIRAQGPLGCRGVPISLLLLLLLQRTGFQLTVRATPPCQNSCFPRDCHDSVLRTETHQNAFSCAFGGAGN